LEAALNLEPKDPGEHCFLLLIEYNNLTNTFSKACYMSYNIVAI